MEFVDRARGDECEGRKRRWRGEGDKTRLEGLSDDQRMEEAGVESVSAGVEGGRKDVCGGKDGGREGTTTNLCLAIARE